MAQKLLSWHNFQVEMYGGIKMPAVSRMFFGVAICFLVAGILVGLHMSITHNHQAVGAHAHINLLGWVTMAIFGTYHALNPAGANTGLAKLQFYTYTIGVVIMTPSLYLLVTGSPSMEPVVAASSFIVFIGVLMFGAIILRTQKVGAPG
jgi:NADH:ubiquinone oxidoreductase subunit 3 (subunit A)